MGRPLNADIERVWFQIGIGNLLRPTEDRIKQIWDAIQKAS